MQITKKSAANHANGDWNRKKSIAKIEEDVNTIGYYNLSTFSLSGNTCSIEHDLLKTYALLLCLAAEAKKMKTPQPTPKHSSIAPLVLLTALLLALVGLYAYKGAGTKSNNARAVKLYWFIPDGVRAEPFLFNMFAWAKEGKLPNIKRLIEGGSYGYSYPNFPSHTPTYFATLLTGSYPEIHGVNDGPMHAIGKPLDSVAVGGFRSVAKKVAPI